MPLALERRPQPTPTPKILLNQLPSNKVMAEGTPRSVPISSNSMPNKSISFSVRLPLIALLFCYVSLASLTTISYIDLRDTSRGGDVRVRTPHTSIIIPRNRFFLASVTGSGALASRTVQAINFPAMISEILASFMMHSLPYSWRPKIFGDSPSGLFVWRGLIFPIYCLPFWWFAGLGIDAFRGRRFHWTIFLFGTLATAFFAFIGIGLAFSEKENHYQDDIFVFAGFVIWVALFSVYPITWGRSLLRSRKLRRLAHT
jgi:hypothetical protein